MVKFSPQHTSVQWTAAAVAQLRGVPRPGRRGHPSALVDGCAALRDSIDAAVAAGRLAVAPPAYEQAPAAEQAPASGPVSKPAQGPLQQAPSLSEQSPVRDFYQVTVAEVIRETGDASSFVLDVPPSLAAAFAYRPGQFVTVRVPSDRTGSVARCYSLCSSPHAEEPPAITVKRTDGGYASNWFLDQRHGGHRP